MTGQNNYVKASTLRNKILVSLRSQGFRLRSGVVLPPDSLTKEKIRGLHELAVAHRRERAKDGLYRKEADLLKGLAHGSEVDPGNIAPRLIEVQRNSWNELLFRYAVLHWSIPVSNGYGRRLRFLVVDGRNDKLIGVIGLGDPVFGMATRDLWIGWNHEDRRKRLRHVMDAYVLGTVPPYSFLLCGKLVAMLAASDEVRLAFKRKYQGVRSRISRRPHDGRLALITTTSALGRSSIYNRLRFHDRLLFASVGFTGGSGEFHFSNGLYGALSRFAAENCEPGLKKARWGDGFRNRREVLKKCLPELGLPTSMLYHGIRRELFVVPLARNAREFLCGEHDRLQWFAQPAADLFAYFRDRWLLPRASWDQRYREWSPDTWKLWTGE